MGRYTIYLVLLIFLALTVIVVLLQAWRRGQAARLAHRKNVARLDARWEVDDWDEVNDTVVGIRRIARLPGWEELVEEHPIYRLSMREPNYPEQLDQYREMAKLFAASRNGAWGEG